MTCVMPFARSKPKRISSLRLSPQSRKPPALKATEPVVEAEETGVPNVTEPAVVSEQTAEPSVTQSVAVTNWRTRCCDRESNSDLRNPDIHSEAR